MSQDLIALHEQAADWFLRRSEPGWTGADERALNAWLAASTQHREIYDGMALTSHDLHQIPLAQDGAWRPRAAAGAVSAPGAADGQAGRRLNRAAGADNQAVRAANRAPVGASQSAGSSQSASRWGRRAWLSSALAACAVLAVGGGYGWQHWQHWQHAPTYQLDLATAEGETRTLDLPDGSTIALNIHSKLRVRYSNSRREVVLAQGEAFFKVARDSARPFTVDAGASEVKVVGTAFNVRAAPAQTVVKVLEGRVEVRPEREVDRSQVYVLKPGNGLNIDQASHRVRAIAATADTVGDWRSGQLHFRRTALADVAAELQTYLGQPIVVEGALAQQPISGVASTSNPRAFLQALPALLPLRVQQQTDGSWRIAAVR